MTTMLTMKYESLRLPGYESGSNCRRSVQRSAQAAVERPFSQDRGWHSVSPTEGAVGHTALSRVGHSQL